MRNQQSSQQSSAEETIKYLQDHEVEELYTQIKRDTSCHSIRNWAIFQIAKYCALRVSEIGLIRLEDYRPLTREIYTRRLKGSRNNTIRIVNPTVLTAIDDYYDLRKNINTSSNSLFISQLGKAIDRRTLDKLMKKYCSYTSIPRDKHHFHVLKHTRAMELIDCEFKIQDVQWYLGHKAIANTMIYLSFTSTAQENLFRKLEEKEGEIINGEKSKNIYNA